MALAVIGARADLADLRGRIKAVSGKIKGKTDEATAAALRAYVNKSLADILANLNKRVGEVRKDQSIALTDEQITFLEKVQEFKDQFLIEILQEGIEEGKKVKTINLDGAPQLKAALEAFRIKRIVDNEDVEQMEQLRSSLNVETAPWVTAAVERFFVIRYDNQLNILADFERHLTPTRDKDGHEVVCPAAKQRELALQAEAHGVVLADVKVDHPHLYAAAQAVLQSREQRNQNITNAIGHAGDEAFGFQPITDLVEVSIDHIGALLNTAAWQPKAAAKSAFAKAFAAFNPWGADLEALVEGVKAKCAGAEELNLLDKRATNSARFNFLFERDYQAAADADQSSPEAVAAWTKVVKGIILAFPAVCLRICHSQAMSSFVVYL